MNEDDAVEAFMTAIVDNKNWHVSTPQKVRVERAARLLWAQAQVEALQAVIDETCGTEGDCLQALGDPVTPEWIVPPCTPHRLLAAAEKRVTELSTKEQKMSERADS